MNAPLDARALVSATPATGLAERDATPRCTHPQDWEKLVSPGHVLGQRLNSAGRWASVLALPAFGLSLALVAGLVTGRGQALPLPTLSVPAFVTNALTYDPATYVDLGAGQRADYRLAWLADIPRSKGLTETEWLDLNKAALADVRTHGFLTDRYSALPTLATPPKVTRPEKALTEYRDRLATGLVTIPAQGQPTRVHIVAMVNGAWAWTVVESNTRCSSFGAVPVPTCAAISNASPLFADLRPTKQ